MAQLSDLKRDKPKGWEKQVKKLCTRLGDLEGLPSDHGVRGDADEKPWRPRKGELAMLESGATLTIAHPEDPKRNGAPMLPREASEPAAEIVFTDDHGDPIREEIEAERHEEINNRRKWNAEELAIFAKWFERLVPVGSEKEAPQNIAILRHVLAPPGATQNDLAKTLKCSRSNAGRLLALFLRTLQRVSED
jgi:hypothetical protein